MLLFDILICCIYSKASKDYLSLLVVGTNDLMAVYVDLMLLGETRSVTHST